MCRNKAEQITHIQKNLIIYICKKNKDNSYIPIGTGFLINNDGTFMTAKHNIDFSLGYSYWGMYHGKYYEIYKIEKFDYQYSGVDIVILKLNVQLNFKPHDFLVEFTSQESLLIAEEVIVVGYENKKNRLLCTTGTICGVTNGKYEIQNANVGSGNSGAPVILKKDLKTLVGVMSKREGLIYDLTTYKIDSEKFGIGYAHSINHFRKKRSFDFYRSSNALCRLLDTKPWDDWDSFFYRHIKTITTEYRKYPNPLYIYNTYFKFYKISSITLEHFCLFLIQNQMFLYSIGIIYQLIGNILINSGILSFLPQAREYLQYSDTIFQGLNYNIDEIIKQRIRVNWLISITYKLERNYGMAFVSCENILKNFRNDCNKYNIDYSSGLILPEREIAVIEQQPRYFDTLRAKSRLYDSNLLETFFTDRRLFEFFLNKHDIRHAKEILPNLKISFQKSRNQLEPIYRFTLAKNMYQYYTLTCKKKKAKRAFEFALTNFDRWGLVGQQCSIQKLRDNLSL